MKRRRLLGAGALSGLLSSAALPLGALPLLAGAGMLGEPRSIPGLADVVRVTWTGAGDLDIRQGDEASLAVEAEPRVQRALTARVVGDTLELAVAPGGFRTEQPVRWRLVLRRLSSLAVAGSGTVTVGPLQADAFELRAAGSGELHIERLRAATQRVEGEGAMDVRIAAGRVGTQRVTLRGAGDYQADELASADAEVAIAGSGSASVRAERTLVARIDGSGDIDYRGNPGVRQALRGSGSLTRH